MKTSNSSIGTSEGASSQGAAKGRHFRSLGKSLVVGMCVMGTALPVLGGDFSKSLVSTPPPVEDEWQFSWGLYGWLTDIKGKTTSGEKIDIPLDEILDNLEGIFFSDFAVRKGKWAVNTDVIYFKIRDDINNQILDYIEMSAWVVTPSVSYRVMEGDWGNLDVLVGARYLYLKTKVGYLGGSVSASGDNWDAICGVRGGINLPNRWYMPYYFDIGSGDSKMTWQASAGIGYHFDKWDVSLTYRYLEFDLDDTPLDYLNVRGPLIGARYHF
jgi:hypothetical protein